MNEFIISTDEDNQDIKNSKIKKSQNLPDSVQEIVEDNHLNQKGVNNDFSNYKNTKTPLKNLSIKKTGRKLKDNLNNDYIINDNCDS